MSHITGQHAPALKFVLTLHRQFKVLVLTASLSALLSVPAHPQDILAAREQNRLPSAKTAAEAASAQLPGSSSLDLPALIRESDRNGTAMHLRLPEYTYLQKRLSREVGQRGQITESVSLYEAYPIKATGRHRHVISLISKDGVPVSPKRREKERQRAVKLMEAAERNETGSSNRAVTASAEKYVTTGIGVSQAGEGVWVGVSQFLRKCEFSAPRHERLDDRDSIALTFRSCADDPSVLRERYIAKMVGIVWIDAVDKAVARLEAWPDSAPEGSQDLFSARPATETIVYEQMRLPTGLWVPRRIRLSAIGKAALFNGVDKDMTFEFSRYQHFSTEVKDVDVVAPKPKP
jgi:hypothetical protein